MKGGVARDGSCAVHNYFPRRCRYASEPIERNGRKEHVRIERGIGNGSLTAWEALATCMEQRRIRRTERRLRARRPGHLTWREKRLRHRKQMMASRHIYATRHKWRHPGHSTGKPPESLRVLRDVRALRRRHRAALPSSPVRWSGTLTISPVVSVSLERCSRGWSAPRPSKALASTAWPSAFAGPPELRSTMERRKTSVADRISGRGKVRSRLRR